MTASVVRPEVVRFVQQVRAALDDLTPEEVDELTDGLTADLSDALGADEVSSLGDPAVYAAELRAAAGLPARAARAGGSALAVIATLDQRILDGARARLDEQRWWPGVRDFLVVLRPVWWVVRAWAVWQIVLPVHSAMGHVLPRSLGSVFVLGMLVVASVELGRRAGAPRPWRRLLTAAVNAVAVLCLFAALSIAAEEPEPADGSLAPQVASSSNGLWTKGEPVRDVFAYDGQGQLIPVVQLYDQDGRPLDLADESRVVPAEDGAMARQLAPVVNADGRQLWNVYPVHGAGTNAPPFRSVAPVAGPTPTPRPTPTAASSGPTPQGTPGRG